MQVIIKMKSIPYNKFIFSPRYRVWRHIIYWVFDIFIWACFWTLMVHTFWHNLFKMVVLLPVFILYSYPVAYWAVPKILLKGKFVRFVIFVLLWGVLGWFINQLFRFYIFIPAQEAMHFKNVFKGIKDPAGYLCLITTTSGVVVFAIFKQWIQKQRQWLQAQQEKITAELQLMKAQLHPHLLFNTLNNIYSFSLEQSSKTPGMILKLSSLLSYMLYDCRTDEVRLEKEIEIMKNYVDLERERYGDRIEISWSAEGDIKDKFIAPFLMLPFLENAFKHGTSEQIEKPWLGVDISVKHDVLRCKIANSKNEYVVYNNNGIGISNVKKRLEFIYPEKYELKMSDEGNFFVVSMVVKLNDPVNSISPLLSPEISGTIKADDKASTVLGFQ